MSRRRARRSLMLTTTREVSSAILWAPRLLLRQSSRLVASFAIALMLWSGIALADSRGPVPAVAPSKSLVNLAGTSIAQATTNYLYAGAPGPNGGTSQASPIAYNGTFKNLYFQSVTGPAAGQTFTITLMVGSTPAGAASGPTAVTCTVSNPATTCNDTTHTAAVTAGQYYAIQIVTSATSGPTGSIGIGTEFDTP